MITIPKFIIEKIIDHAKKEYPCECCGFLSGQDKQVSEFYMIGNDDQSRKTYFMNPKELLAAQKDMREKKNELIGIYHSHPHTEAYPSKTDIEKAHWPDSDLPLFPGTLYVIISLEDQKDPVIRAFDINKDSVKEAKFQII